MPRILRIINRLNLGGPTYNASYLSKYMDDCYETILVSGMKDETEASSEFIAESMGLKPIYLSKMFRSINPYYDFQAYKQIETIIKHFKPDIVHTHAAKAGALGRLAAYNNNVPVILHTFHGHVFHSYFNPLKTKVFLNIERFLASKSSRIIAISKKQKQELGEQFKVAPLNKIEVIPLGFNLDKFQQNVKFKRKEFRYKYNLDEDEIAIGIIGRLVPIKNHTLFLEAIKRVLERSSKKIRAFIIGDGEERLRLEIKAKELNIPFIDADFRKSKATLTFTSWIKEVDYAIAGLDIIALTSLNEGTPVSLIEAQAATKPIVSTRVGGIEDVVLEGETALLSPPRNVELFANNLLKIVEDDNIRFTMGKTGFEHAIKQFHYMRLVNNTQKLYERLLNR